MGDLPRGATDIEFSELSDAAFRHHNYAVGQSEQVALVQDHEDGLAVGLQVADSSGQSGLADVIEVGVRLIQHDDFGRYGNCSGQRESLPLPAGQQ